MLLSSWAHAGDHAFGAESRLAEGAGSPSRLAILANAWALLKLMTGALRARFGEIIRETNKSTMAITSMIFVILLGATAFALVFTRMGGGDLVEDFLHFEGAQLQLETLVEK